MPDISTYSTSDNIVFVTVRDGCVVSAPVSLDINITFQLSAHV